MTYAQFKFNSKKQPFIRWMCCVYLPIFLSKRSFKNKEGEENYATKAKPNLR